MAFEISVLVRDSLGNVICNADGIPKRKSFNGDTGYAVWEYWNRNGTHLRRKNKKNNKKENGDGESEDP